MAFYHVYIVHKTTKKKQEMSPAPLFLVVVPGCSILFQNFSLLLGMAHEISEKNEISPIAGLFLKKGKEILIVVPVSHIAPVSFYIVL